MLTTQSHQRETCQAHQFESQINHQEMVARNHDVNAQQAEQPQGEQLPSTLQHVPLRRVLPCVNQCEHQGQRGQGFEPTAERISQHHAAKTV